MREHPYRPRPRVLPLPSRWAALLRRTAWRLVEALSVLALAGVIFGTLGWIVVRVAAWLDSFTQW